VILLTALAGVGAAAPSPERRTPVVRVVEKVSPAVVSVTVKSMVTTAGGLDWFFRDFVPPRQRRLETVSQGSGVVIEAGGYVLTNYHVISAGGEIVVELADNRRLDAETVGTSPDHDLAVLKVKSDKALPFVPMGTSYDLMIGEPVIAIGNPFGLSHTVTTGVVSALHRSIQAEDRTYSDFIQTDASINPGNSGGPLLNIEGMLIGINTAIYGKAQGIGFAIPIDKARRIVDDLVRYGEVRRPYYGFDTQDLTADLAESFASKGQGGALVSQVDPRGPAAGKVQEGDIVTSLDGVRIGDAHELRSRLGDFTAGAKVDVGVLRGAKEHTVEITAAVLAPEEALRRVEQHTGLRLAELAESEARRARLPARIIVVEGVTQGSPAWQAGIRRGDWVRSVNSEKVVGMNAFGKAMARSYWRGQVLLLIQRGRVWQQFAFDL
jgi:Do/DeqQ family serine protease